MKNQQGLRGAQRLIVCQMGLAILMAVVASLVSGGLAAWSAIWGGLVCLLPNVYFARKLFQHQGARAAQRIVSNFYKGEMLKIVFSIVLFAFAFAFFNVIPIVFFTTYILAQMVFWFAPWIFNTRPNSD